MVLFFSLIFTFSFLLFNFSSAASPDAIAIRVIPNPDHLSPIRWYTEKGFTGSPQSMEVDGFEAVRDGRTVYINAANIVDTDSDTFPDTLYTNIYLISYTQNAESVTVDIFGQILSHWKFLTNITGSGNCLSLITGESGVNCTYDSECGENEYCTGIKSKVIRDTRRLADLADIEKALENYKNRNGYYPKLSSGSYLPNVTISTWPSWQEALGVDLGAPLPVDPVNKLGACAGSEIIGKTGSQFDSTNASCYTDTGVDYTRSCNNAFWDYSFSVAKSGNYTAHAETTNNNSSVMYGDLDTIDFANPISCPEFGIQHKVEVAVDGVTKGYFCNDAVGPDKAHQIGNVDLGFLASGNHTVRFSWTNDWTWNPDGVWGTSDDADSNIKIYNVGLIGEGQYLSQTCWNEELKKFADPIPGNGVIDLPISSSAYTYAAAADGSSYSLNLGIEADTYLGAAAYGSSITGNSPVFGGINLPTGYYESPYSGFINASDPDGDNLSWQLNSLSYENGITVHNWTFGTPVNSFLSGTLSWNNPEFLANTSNPKQKKIAAQSMGLPGTYTFNVSISDGSNTVNRDFSFTVGDEQPVIQPIDTKTVVIGKELNMDIRGWTDTDNLNFNFTYPADPLSPPFPLSCTAVKVTGSYNFSCPISVNPVVIPTGDYEFEVTATDTNGISSEPEIFTIRVTNGAPQISTASLPSLNICSGYSAQVAAADPDGHTLIYSASGLPASMSINPSSGIITGDLPNAAGTYPITVNVRDQYFSQTNPPYSAEVSKNLNIYVSDEPFSVGVSIVSDTVYVFPGISIDFYRAPVTYFASASVSGASGMVYALENNPSWLAIDPSTGEIQGTPTDPSDVGTHTVTVRATNSCGNSATADIVIKVENNEWCGDGLANGTASNTEECDGSDFRGRTCSYFDYLYGNLVCDSSCNIISDDCSNTPTCVFMSDNSVLFNCAIRD